MSFRPTIIVLATSRGRRSPARANGLGLTLRHAIESRLPVVAVATAGQVAAVAEHLAVRDTVVIGDEAARRGMGHAIAAGVAERSSAPGWLVLPGDMGAVQPQTLQSVARALEQHAIAFAQHRGRRGHPVGFAAELYTELVLLNDDDGVRRLIARYPAYAAEVDDPGVLGAAGSDLETLRSAGS